LFLLFDAFYDFPSAGLQLEWRMILCIGTTPALQRVMLFQQLTLDAVNRAATTLDGVAGKSINVVKVLHTLGAAPMALGFLGGDRGEEVRRLLAERGIAHHFVTVAPRTRQCITVVDQAGGTITELVEESRPVASAAFDELEMLIARHLPSCQAVVLSGTITPGGPIDLYKKTVERACQNAKLSVVDAQGPALLQALPAGPGLVKPNRAELAATVGRPLESEKEVCAGAEELHRRGAQRVVVTAGKDPAVAFDGCTFWRILSPRIRAVNPIGSGDAFTAALVWKLAQGADLGEACRWGAAAGAANALTPMPGELDRSEVERLAGEASCQRI
jgi:tagatose 6-phosphate kinase